MFPRIWITCFGVNGLNTNDVYAKPGPEITANDYINVILLSDFSIKMNVSSKLYTLSSVCQPRAFPLSRSTATFARHVSTESTAATMPLQPRSLSEKERDFLDRAVSFILQSSVTNY